MDYKSSGVDIDAGNETVRRIKKLAKGTFTPGVLSDIGSFGGLFKLDTSQWKEPVLVDLEHPSVNITGIEPAGK